MIDTVTLEVIYHRLESIADEMENALLKSSFSTVVKESRDATAAIFDADGRTAAQACAIPVHLGTLMFSVPEILKVFPVSEMRDGDVYLANDPYSGGTHLNDITMVVPVIYQDEVVALSCNMVHHQDIGAISPGTPTRATSLYQEGLNLPPIKFYDAGEPVKAIHDIIRKNVRIPDIVIGDLRAQVSAANVGKCRMLELFEEYGKEVVLTAMDELLDRAEALTRHELKKIPDGTYTFVDYMDNDGIELDKPIRIQVAVTIQDSDFIVDFTGTSPQVKGPFNCVPSVAYAVTCYAVKAITGGSYIPNNNGCFRPISLVLPEGSIVNPYPVLGALVKALPDRLPACSSGVMTSAHFGGTDPLKGEFVTCALDAGGQGARPNKDGVDAIHTDMCVLMNVPAEYMEKDFPVRILRNSLRNDSAGAGEYRGGLGLDKVFEIVRGEVSTSCRIERHYSQPWGILGGLPGSKGAAFVIRQAGEKEEFTKRDMTLYQGDQLHILAPGGGGYGDPLKRKPELVLKDVLDRRISLEAAALDYGVVIDKESMALDLAKTSQLREEKARQRGPITWTYDRGPDGGKE
jgi:N-methylhydantoinase B